MERREFQIRETDDYGQEEVTCFTNLAEANEEYCKRLETAQEEGLAIEFELIEVLLRDHSETYP